MHGSNTLLHADLLHFEVHPDLLHVGEVGSEVRPRLTKDSPGYLCEVHIRVESISGLEAHQCLGTLELELPGPVRGTSEALEGLGNAVCESVESGTERYREVQRQTHRVYVWAWHGHNRQLHPL